MKAKKIIAVVLLLIILGAVGGYFYLYQGHRDIKEESSFAQVTSKNLVSEFTTSLDKANGKYLNKTIEVSGKVTEVTDSTLVLDEAVFCSFQSKAEPSLVGKSVMIKGRCIGFDELFGEVKLDQSTILEKE